MQAAIAPFETVSDLKAAHEALLVEQDAILGDAASEADEAASVRELEARINEFVARAVATGALIEALKDRTACQVLLDYWSSALARADLARPQTKLAPFDEARLPDLKRVLRERNVPAPYVGLDPFGLGDRERFFGRDADIRELVARVERLPLTIVTGASGSGKSSLVLAGLLPELQKEGWAISGEPRTPGNDALGHFAESLAGLLEPPVSPALRSKWAADQATAMRADAQHAAKLLQGSGAERSVLVIDQFEEIFTLAAPGDREALAANLAAILAPGAKLCRAVVTVREEFKDQINQLTVLEGMTKDAWYAMRPLTYGELRQAVEGPAGKVGLVFQEGIVDDLVKKVLGQPAALPLLQFTLKQLWQGVDRNRITQEVYKRVGDPLVALKLNADRTYAALPEQEKLVAKEILLQLVAVDTLGDFYRVPVRRKDLRATHASVIPEVLRKLEEADFIRAEHDEESPGESLVEIKHESLLRNWPLLVDWVREKREQHLRRSQFSRMAEEWVASGRPAARLLTGFQVDEAGKWPDLSDGERDFIRASEEHANAEKNKLRRRLHFAIAGFGFAVVMLAVALWQWSVAVDARKEAERQRGIATSRALAALAKERAPTDPELGLRLAAESVRGGSLPDEALDALSVTLSAAPTLVMPRFDGSSARFERLALTGDSSRLIALETADKRSFLRVYDTGTGERTKNVELPAELRSMDQLAVSTRADRAAVLGDEGIALVDLAAGKLIRFGPSPIQSPRNYGFTADQSAVYLVDDASVATVKVEDGGTAVLLKADRLARTAKLSPDTRRLAVTPDLTYAIAGDNTGKLLVLGGDGYGKIVATKSVSLKPVDKQQDENIDLQVIADRTLLLEYAGEVILFDLPDLRERRRYDVGTTSIRVVRSPNGNRFLTSHGELATVTDVGSGVSLKLPRTTSEIHRPESPATFSSDGMMLVGVDEEGRPRATPLIGWVRGNLATISASDIALDNSTKLFAVRASGEDAADRVWDIWNRDRATKVLQAKGGFLWLNHDETVLFAKTDLTPGTLYEAWAIGERPAPLYRFEAAASTNVKFSEDGRIVALDRDGSAGRGRECAVLSPGGAPAVLPVTGDCEVVLVRSNPPRLVVKVQGLKDQDDALEIWDWEKAARIASRTQKGELRSGGDWLVFGTAGPGAGDQTEILNIRTGDAAGPVAGRLNKLSDDGRWLLTVAPGGSGGRGYRYTVYETDGARPAGTISGRSMRFLPGSHWLLREDAESGDDGRAFGLFRLRSGQALDPEPWVKENSRSVSLSPGGRFAAFESTRGRIRVHDLRDRALLLDRPLAHVSFGAGDGLLALTTPLETSVVDANLAPVFSFHAPAYEVFKGAEFSPDGRRLFLYTDRNAIAVHSLDRKELAGPLLKERLARTRPMTEAECRRYLGLSACPTE
jgi:hypothetical protein